MHHCLYEDNFVVYLARNEGANRILSDVFNQVRVTHKDNGAGPIAHNNSHKGFFSVEHATSKGFDKLYFPVSTGLIIENTFSQKNCCQSPYTHSCRYGLVTKPSRHVR